MKARQKRMMFIGLGLAGVGVAAWLAIGALRGNIAYFFSPSQVLAKEAPANAAVSYTHLDVYKRQAGPPVSLGSAPMHRVDLS